MINFLAKFHEKNVERYFKTILDQNDKYIPSIQELENCIYSYLQSYKLVFNYQEDTEFNLYCTTVAAETGKFKVPLLPFSDVNSTKICHNLNTAMLDR